MAATVSQKDAKHFKRLCSNMFKVWWNLQ